MKAKTLLYNRMKKGEIFGNGKGNSCIAAASFISRPAAPGIIAQTSKRYTK